MTEYEDALQYFERKRDSARKRYEAALRRGDEVQALQLKVKARRMEVAVEAIGVRLDMFQADIIQVVRCKDCKHRRQLRSAPAEMKYGKTHCECGFADTLVRLDHFCSWGERREENA